MASWRLEKGSKLANDSVKLIYVAAQFRIKAEVVRQSCIDFENAPEDLFSRAESKMQSLKDSGEISCFAINKEGFNEFWTVFRQAAHLAKDKIIQFVLAEGSPELKELRIELIEHPTAIASLSLATKDKNIIKSWRKEWIIFRLNFLLQELGEGRLLNNAQIHAAWFRALSGMSIEGLLLGSCPPPPTLADIKSKPYAIVANKTRKEVTLILRDVEEVVSKIGSDKIVELVQDATNNIAKQTDGHFQVLKKNIISECINALNCPAVLGLDLPVVILGSIGSSYIKTTKQPDDSSKVSEKKLPKGKLPVTISPDNMEAVISGSTIAFYTEKNLHIDEDWLLKELAIYKINPDLFEPYRLDILNKIAMREDLDGMTLATGKECKGGTKPYLFTDFKEMPAEIDGEAEEDLNIRDAQQRQIVKTGQLVASLKYANPPEAGYDIFGNKFESSDHEHFDVLVGDGVEERDVGKYYATFDGIPHVDKNKISLSKIMVHKGDVNLRTGNINFDGPVEITGSIDSGASVYVTGNLKVKGSIRNAFVRCGGDIEVQSGIVTGEKGLVSAKREIKAEFIENSNIQCGGSLLVAKVLINSSVISGGRIEVLNKKTGTIAGGKISCKDDLMTGNLGFKNGNITELNIGVDWQAELSVRIRTLRKQKVLDAQKSDRLALREVLNRNKNQMTAKHEERKVHYQNRLVKERALLEKMEVHLEQAKSQLVYDESSRVFVHETVFANVNISIGGNPVTVKHDVAGVAILGRRRQGTKIVPIETMLVANSDGLDDD